MKSDEDKELTELKLKSYKTGCNDTLNMLDGWNKEKLMDEQLIFGSLSVLVAYALDAAPDKLALIEIISASMKRGCAIKYQHDKDE